MENSAMTIMGMNKLLARLPPKAKIVVFKKKFGKADPRPLRQTVRLPKIAFPPHFRARCNVMYSP